MGKQSGKRKADGEQKPSLGTDILQVLHEPEDFEQFVKESWGQKPVLIKATAKRKGIFKMLLSTPEQLVELVKQNDDLTCGLDIHVQTDAIEEGQFVEPDVLEAELKKDGMAMQVVQPQRMHDGLWEFVGRLEASMGCLVSCTSQLHVGGGEEEEEVLETEAETWVCQTSGSHRWRELGTVEALAKQQSEEEQEEKEVDKMDVTLTEGDVLYIPRGRVFAHQGTATCAYLLLTTHQNGTWGHVLAHMIKAFNSDRTQPMRLPAPFNRALPPGLGNSLNLVQSMVGDSEGATDDAYSVAEKQTTTTLVQGLRALAAAIESRPDDYLPPALESWSEEFLRHRLPPHPAQLREQGPEPELDDHLVVRGQGLFSLVPVEAHPDPETPEGFLVVTTPLFNERKTHMLRLEGDGHEDHDSDDLDMLMGSDDSEGEGEESEEEAEEKAGAGKTGKQAGKASLGNGKAVEGSEDEEEPEEGKKKKNHKHCHHHHHHHHHHHEEGEEDLGCEDSDDSDGSDDSDDEEPLPGPVVPAGYALALARVLNSTEEPGVRVRDLLDLVPNKDETEVMNMVYMLWSEGFVSCIKGSEAAAKEKDGRKESKAETGAAADEPAAKKARKAEGKAGGKKK